mmetsp:Transcript_28546/g.90974  ORF Transcript_28546/g.90974 Transcript_28546/m.90974 type:complete len:613 (-) Transcript_28546:48-1886(-)|eukprot:CAMPEP_0182913734 /NCGR_PEP_ID=MMETSP0034_2-20130328/38186_1 /TAXON_ID=156128 /ORGANISM="Nephroselmis pyriformis, Strain CCMP717" /LENGTH=612 /DNA_ID=CAMNT_0025050463 /DNA_START=88 /DNA_END=1926 /DNA_ORIENTATION=+
MGKSDAEKKAARDAKAAERANKKMMKAAIKEASENGSEVDLTKLDLSKAPVPEGNSAKDKEDKPFRTVTGVLTSRPTARDIKIDSFSMGLGGTELIQDCAIEVTIGRRYGLLGQNGCGKSNFMQCLAHREVPIPDHVDIYHLQEEAEPTDRNALESVVDWIKDEIARLEKLEEYIMTEHGPEDDRLAEIYEKLDSLDPATFEAKAAELLHGLGFSKKMMGKATKDMSGGWRMRVALARALFVAPTLLLLDEPTNHLDLEACVWLEEYLKTYPKCLILISHSQDFLNGVCTHIIWITQQRLTYYTGNYDTYCKSVAENEIIQHKKWQQEQADIKHLKQFIASCGTYSNMVKQAQSKQKILDKMYAAGLTPPVTTERHFKFNFPECQKLPPPVMPFDKVAFSYSGKPEDCLYTNLNLAVDCDSRIALVGPNGAGKSTLLKLMIGELTPNSGVVGRHAHLSIARYHQHSTDVLDNSMTVLDFFRVTYPNTATFSKDIDEWRSFVGRYGISGKMQTSKIGHLSEGQKSRIVIAMMSLGNPNMLLLDEPTNHLDMEAIDALAQAIKKFNGGMVLVSHDFRLIDQVAEQIWICDKGDVKIHKGDIRSYKEGLKKQMGL